MLMVRKPITLEDAAAKRHEANELFTPSAPIAIAELFAGRQLQASKILDAIGERGRHIILFGERGVGKSSIAQITPFLVPRGARPVKYIRVQAFPAMRSQMLREEYLIRFIFAQITARARRFIMLANFTQTKFL